MQRIPGTTHPAIPGERTNRPTRIRRPSLALCSSVVVAALAGCGESELADLDADDADCRSLLCAPTAPIPTQSPAGTPGVASSELTGAGAAEFSAFASLPADPYCSDSDYSRIDFCTNQSNPPAPGIARRVGTARARDASDRVSPYLAGNHDDLPDGVAPPPTAQGERVVTPPTRASNDGRLHLTPEYFFWPSLSYFRPETLTYDSVRKGTDDVAAHKRGALHAFTFWNPMDTELDPDVPGVRLLSRLNALHSTLCDASSADFEADDRPRNPVPCSARYGDFPYDNAAPTNEELEVQHGHCYQVSFLGSVEHGENGTGRQELRSNELTVFVSSAYRPDSANTVWVYPRNPEGVFDAVPASGEVELPDFADYDLERIMPWDRLEDPRTLLSSPSLQFGYTHPVDGACYTLQNGAYQPNPAAPPFCAFLYTQRRTSTFYFDNDHDATPDRHTGSMAEDLEVWGGKSKYFIFEPVTTGDGKLLLINNNAGVYYSTSDTACDAAGFHSYIPYSVMPNDPVLHAAGYKIALATGGQPFRDPTGREIPFGSTQRFAYQWIDRAGTNLFLATVNESRDEYQVDPDTIRRTWTDASLGDDEVTPDVDQVIEQEGRLRALNTRAGHQFGVLGGWTSGQLVILDNGLNASDLGGARGWANGSQYDLVHELPLYSDASLKFSPQGVALMGSAENRFNHLDALRPRLPFDVVWTVSGINQTASEVVFDDYMDRRAFAVVHMNPSVRLYHEEEHLSAGASLAAVENGFMAQGDPWSFDPQYVFNVDDTRDGEPGARVILQNAAPFTTVNNVRLRGGARVEPVGLGGVLGRGVFLDGVNDFMDMGYPLPADDSWFLGLWIEPHAVPQGTIEEVFHFADGSFVGLKATAAGYNLIARRASGAVHEVPLGSLIHNERFFHLGFRTVKPASNQLSRSMFFYVNGTRVATINLPSGTQGAGLQPAVGCQQQGCWTWMTVGAPWPGAVGNAATRSLRGWVDELRIYRLRPEDAVVNAGFEEQVCNFALGSLADPAPAGPVPAAITELQALIKQQTGTTPAAVCEQLVLESIDEPFDLPRQHRRTSCASRVHAASAPAHCLRSAKLGLPTLVADDPRPSSASTPFCKTCHTDAAHFDGLRMRALQTAQQNPTVDLLPRFADPRRQPLNPPAVVALPRHDCSAPQLDDTWYARFLLDGSLDLGEGQWTGDHLFDAPSTQGYLPPVYP